MIPTTRLCNGQKMPLLGLGTWKLSGKKCFEAVKKALELGYNHIDTAQIYANQKEIAKVISGFDRNSLFITSKLWLNSLRKGRVRPGCDRILRELNTGFVDLLLIHWPDARISIGDTLEAMNALVEQGKAKAIGVSNFTTRLLEEALAAEKAEISVNQVEFHPLLFQSQLLEFCNQHGISITAYSPLARQLALENLKIKEISKKIERTPAQICLRWILQKGCVAIPKASGEQHLKENMEIFDWSLSKEDEKEIDSIGLHQRLINPDFAEFGEEE